ncbi:MAG: acyl-CoA dehydrogenase family protein, partial [Myxococcales bacterium]|nr:acyl-CoA dehydrogenase family protein [Myxococcales bacterium]
MSVQPTPPTVDELRPLVEAAEGLVGRSLERVREITGGPSGIDDHQVIAERIAYAATEARTARELLSTAEASEGGLGALAGAGIAELVNRLRNRLEPLLDDLGLTEGDLEAAFPAPLRNALRRLSSEAFVRAVGRAAIESRGQTEWPLDETLAQVRDAVREFADAEIAPEAERIHRDDDIIPEKFISKMAELGYFGMSIPEQYDGFDMG